MSMEQNEPERSAIAPPPASLSTASEAASGTAPQANGGQQRRRRRRRKNRGGGAHASAAPNAAEALAPQPTAPEERIEASSDEAPSPQATEGVSFRQAKRPSQNNSQGGGQSAAPQFQNNGGGGKKKHWQNKGGGGGQQGNGQGQHFQANGSGKGDRQFGKQNREYNPGNSVYGPGGGPGNRRKNKKGRGPGSFVGPMDHSYRVPNGNVADGSQADYRNQREVNGNVIGRNGYYDELDMYMPVGPAREDAPVRIFMFVEDLFVIAKTQETARKLGIKVQFAKAEKETLQAIMEAPEEERASLIVFDLNNANAKPLTTIPKLRAKLKRGTSIIGFLSHIQGDLKVKATEAGCDMVMPKAAFSQNLPNLLRRHGIEDEEFEAVEA